MSERASFKMRQRGARFLLHSLVRDRPNSAPAGPANHILPTFDTMWAQQKNTQTIQRVADQDFTYRMCLCHPHKSVYKYFVSVKLYNQPVNGYDLKQLSQVRRFFLTEWTNHAHLESLPWSHLSNLVINQ